MKFLIFSILFSLCLYSGEIQRMESILKDIEVLRGDYLKCKKALNMKNIGVEINLIEEEKIAQNYKTLLDKEKNKNTLLVSQIDLMKKGNKSEKEFKKIENILIIKEKDINSLKNEISRLKKNKEIGRAHV